MVKSESNRRINFTVTLPYWMHIRLKEEKDNNIRKNDGGKTMTQLIENAVDIYFQLKDEGKRV